MKPKTSHKNPIRLKTTNDHIALSLRQDEKVTDQKVIVQDRLRLVTLSKDG